MQTNSISRRYAWRRGRAKRAPVRTESPFQAQAPLARAVLSLQFCDCLECLARLLRDSGEASTFLTWGSFRA